jgi:hypothetical protein
MAQQGGNSKTASSDKQQGRPARPEPGSAGNRGRAGEQYQQKDMGAHPAYGQHPRDPDGKDEDYGNRGLHRRAGTTKLEDRGIGHAEDYDARYDAESSKPRDEARKGRPVISGQSTRGRDAVKRRNPSGRVKNPTKGDSQAEGGSATGEGDLDISPGAAGGGKHSKRDPASR